MSDPALTLLDAYRRLTAYWNAEQAPRPQYLAGPEYLSEWVGGLRHVTSGLTDALDELTFTTAAAQQQMVLTQLLAKLEALLPLVANLPTHEPTQLRKVVASKKTRAQLLSHTAFYQRVTEALAVRGKGPATPPYDEGEPTRLFQHEAIQASYVASRQLLLQRLAALASPLPPRRAAAIQWKLGPGHLLELLLKLQECGHLEIKEINAAELSKAITALFALPHEEQVKSADWEILKPYWTNVEQGAGKKRTTGTKTYTKRPTKPLYDGIAPL